jgi:hypothetical protein
VIEQREKLRFELSAVIIIEIQKDEYSISRRAQAPAVGAQLCGKLIEEAFSPQVYFSERVSGQSPLSPMLNDDWDVLGEKAREPTLQQSGVGRTLHQDVQPQFANLSSK